MTDPKNDVLDPSNEDAQENGQGAEHSAAVFMDNLSDGYTTSLSAHQLPLTISDKALSGKVAPSMAVKKSSRDGWTITHKAAQIINPSTQEVEHYFATKPAMTILDAVWDLINMKKCSLEQDGNTFTVTFRKYDLRKYLYSINKSRSGKQINEQIEILQSSVLEVANSSLKRNDGISNVKLTGTYFQSAYEIESDNPRLDGLYRATLHPVIAEDLMQGRFRDVEKTYLSGTSESNEIYKACIHKMRHQFTNADASAEKISFTILLGDLLFSAGKMEEMTQGAMRRAVNVLREKMVNNGIISSKENMLSEWVFDAARKVNDYQLVITPTIEWGESQRRSNAKYKRQQEQLKRGIPSKIEVLDIKESKGTRIKKLN
ncbi:hypothetical protein [Photobacterium galatheae]|uniref:Replication protein n=1 Tax=Photobacterium galatheae TaxID=1654360 RepID=A0A066RUI6_9GAMM|nr:hypothetical protein [Photobacterium galatheae]KDM91048.1 hypothetical protein EA58_15000 [Photobacterium galatheae]MCM0149000.1 hypothetical protein [Photobacterium galatheae]